MELHEVAVEIQLACRRALRAGEDLHQGRLAGAVGAEHRVDLARLDLHRGVVQREHVAVALADVACLEHAGHAPARASRAARRRRRTPSALTATTTVAPVTTPLTFGPTAQ